MMRPIYEMSRLSVLLQYFAFLIFRYAVAEGDESPMRSFFAKVLVSQHLGGISTNLLDFFERNLH